LEWSNQPAVWGLSPSGQTLLKIPPGSGSLRGEWSLRGRTYFGRVEFDAALLPAVISTVQLRLPATKQLVTSDQTAITVTDDADPAWRNWQLDLGQRTHLHVVISDQSAEPPS